MENKEFNLSEKKTINLMMYENLHKYKSVDGMYHAEDIPTEEWIKLADVKEFIRLLKKEINLHAKHESFCEQVRQMLIKQIDKLAGDKLMKGVQINKILTAIVNTDFGKFEVETKIHHLNKTYAECEKDCPEGWEIMTYELIQYLRNTNPKEFNLIETWEFIQNPDFISKNNGYIARFSADSDWVYLGCDRDPASTDAGLGVRYFRSLKCKKKVGATGK